MTKKHTFKLHTLLAFSLSVVFSAAAVAQDERPKVMAMGVFHFANPGRDVVKSDQIDVMAEGPQAYLERLTTVIIADFKPTRILLEYPPRACDPKRREPDDCTPAWQDKYQQYLDGKLQLSANENYQLGFRIGKAAGGIPISGYDEDDVHWNAGPLFEIIDDVAPETNAEIQQMFADMSTQREQAHKTLSLGALLLQSNDPEDLRANKDLYLMTNMVASEDKHEGADASASWWHRNFRMYGHIQRAAKAGERVLVIGGSGHIAIINDFLAIDRRIDTVDVRPLLEKAQ